MNEQWFEQLGREIARTTGLKFHMYKKDFMKRCIQNRMSRLQMEDMAAYLVYFRKNVDEHWKFCEAVSIYHTEFVRDPVKFHALRDYVLPEVVQRKTEAGLQNLVVWSAGCAGGEEVYSIAMVVREVLSRKCGDWNVRIIGSDINRKLIEKARIGEYAEEEYLRKNGEYYCGNYFEKHNGLYRVKSELRAMVEFVTSDLMKESSRVNVDIIFCRNVLIYFDPAAHRYVIGQFYQALNSRGFLFLGNSEIMEDSFYCKYRKLRSYGEFYYRKIDEGSEEYMEMARRHKNIQAGLGLIK